MSLPTGSGDEGVEEKIDLNLISDEQLDRLEAQADRLEKASQKVNQAMSDLSGAPVDIVGEINDDVLPKGTGGFVGFKQGKLVRGGVRGQEDQTGRAPAPIDDTGMFIDQLMTDVNANEEAINLLKAEMAMVKDNQKINLNEIRGMQQKGIGIAQQGLGAVRDPFGFAGGKLLGIAAKYALPIGAIIGITTGVIEFIKSQFGPEGLFDIRKLMLDEAREYMFQPDLIDIDRGTIYFATSGTINQQAPDFSNTEGKVYGHLKDIVRNPGE